MGKESNSTFLRATDSFLTCMSTTKSIHILVAKLWSQEDRETTRKYTLVVVCLVVVVVVEPLKHNAQSQGKYYQFFSAKGTNPTKKKNQKRKTWRAKPENKKSREKESSWNKNNNFWSDYNIIAPFSFLQFWFATWLAKKCSILRRQIWKGYKCSIIIISICAYPSGLV